MTRTTARRLVLAPGELAGMCARLGLELPPAFRATPDAVGEVHPSVAAGLQATCAPAVGVLVSSSFGDAAFGVRDDLGGSLLRGVESPVEVSVWPAVRLRSELARAVPPLAARPSPPLHLPLDEVPDVLRPLTVGFLRATVVAPPHVLGVVVWVATSHGWVWLQPAQVRRGVRWVDVRPVEPADLAGAVAPDIAMALA
jgi:hypothetical protein